METVTVQAIFEMEVDVSDLKSKHVDIKGLAIELTKREVETLSADDFNYKIKEIAKVF